LLVFRVTQSYGRYWEATGAVYKMQSKWMDATVHVANYHMQSSQYDSIRPPSYLENHHLNEHRLTRDRERVRSSRMALGTSGKISEERAQKRSIEPVNSGRLSKLIGMTPSEDESNSQSQSFSQSHMSHSHSQSQAPSQFTSGEFGVIPVIDNIVEKTLPKRVLVSRISSRRFESALNSEMMRALDYSDDDDDEINIGMSENSERPPKFLTGRPKLDGNWGSLFEDGKSTYLKPYDLKEIDDNGFASIQGGHTPILFLQELAHLSSLLNAVALSTLRNDVEGVSSPLSLYIPGSAWPAVDPKWDEHLYDSKLEGRLYAFLYFLGQGRSPAERAKYNIARPLPVLGGVSDAEIQMLQMARGPMAKTQLCWSWLSELAVREHPEEAHGALLSRAMQFLSDGMTAYNDCRKIMFNPFPFPFAQISSFFVNFMWILVPLLMDQYIQTYSLGVILTFFSVMCLQSIDEVGKELENPFRNIPNELPVVTYQAEYNESLLVINSGFHPDAYWKVPRDIRKATYNKKRASQEPIDDMSTIKEGASSRELGISSREFVMSSREFSKSESERTFQSKEDEHEKVNAQLRLIVDQQNRMMEQMMKEQKRLNDTLEKMLLQSNKQESNGKNSEDHDERKNQ